MIADRDRWRQVAAIFDQAVELLPGEREAFLDRACSDAELRTEVAELLRAEGRPASLLDGSGPAQGAMLVASDLALGSGREDEAGPALVGAYRLVRPLGHGGMGTVFLAERADGGFDQQVALKLIRRDLADDELRRRFLRERQILAGLSHPNIAGLLDGGVAPDGRPYFVLEYVEGEPITAYCTARRLPLEQRLRLFLDVCEAVQAAHERRIVHRDLKPSNVLVTREGWVKLLDFGIAKVLEETAEEEAGNQLTRTGMRPLTPEYAAPEQLRAGVITPAADVYALGVLLVELLTGQRPTGDTTSRPPGEPSASRPDALRVTAEAAAGLGLTTGELRRRLRGDLAAIARTALREEPERRYASAGALARDLRAFLAGEPVTARPDSLAYRGVKLWRRRRSVIVMVALGVVALALAGVVWWSERARAAHEGAVPLAFHLVSTTPGMHRAPTFSPDGTQVAFVDFTRGVPQLWVKALAGGAPRQLTHGEVAVSRPRWSPRGDVIVYAGFRRGEGGAKRVLLAISPRGGEPRRIVENGFSPNFSSDGRQLIFERGSGRIVLADADGGHEHEVQGVPESQAVFFTDMAPALSPDGRRIAFFRCENGPNGDLWVMSAAGGGARQLTHDLRQGGEPVWTPDGERILFTSMRNGSLTLWSIPAAGGTPTPVTTGSGEDTDPSLDASGRHLLYTNSQNSYALTLLDPTSGAERVLLERRGAINFPEFSPDGSRILFFGPTEDGFQIFTLASDGSDLRQVTTTPGEYNIFPHWSGDARWLYFFRYLPKPGLRRVAATGGASTEIHAEWGIHSGARVDPRDRLVAYSVGEPWHPTRTQVRDLASGAERPLSQPVLGMTWSADGSEILGFTLEREIVICAVATGACRAIATRAHSAVWGPDERSVYFLRGPERLEDPTIGRVHVFAVGVDGSGERPVVDLAPIIVFGKSLAVSPRGEILWTKYLRGPHQIWLADLP